MCRQALTDLDRQARDLFVQWCEAAGCSVTVDAIGNIFARRAGRDPALPAGDDRQPYRRPQPTGWRNSMVTTA